MNAPFLKQLAYLSRATRELSRDDLRQLLRQARRRNRDLDVTGLLLVDPPIFLQILEGPPDSVDAVFASIREDPRHTDVDVLYSNDRCPEREFARWRMGCRILGDRRPEDLHGLDDRVKRVLRTARPDGELARRLLREFRELESGAADL